MPSGRLADITGPMATMASPAGRPVTLAPAKAANKTGMAGAATRLVLPFLSNKVRKNPL